MSFFIWEKVLENHKDIIKRLGGIKQVSATQPESKTFLTALAFGLAEAEFLVKTSAFGAEPLADEKYHLIYKEKLTAAYQKLMATSGKTASPTLGKFPLPTLLAKSFWFKSSQTAPLLRVVNNCLPYPFDAGRTKQGAIGVEYFAPSENKVYLAGATGQPPSPGKPLPATADPYDLLVQNAYLTVFLNYHDLAREVASMPPAEFPDRFQEVETTLMKLGFSGDKLARHCGSKGTFLILKTERRMRSTGMLAITDNKGGEHYLDFINEDDDPREKISSLLMELCDATISLKQRG